MQANKTKLNQTTLNQTKLKPNYGVSKSPKYNLLGKKLENFKKVLK
jgi:hypothetical protein